MSPGDKKGVVLVKVDRAYGSLINNRPQGSKVARRSEDRGRHSAKPRPHYTPGARLHVPSRCPCAWPSVCCGHVWGCVRVSRTAGPGGAGGGNTRQAFRAVVRWAPAQDWPWRASGYALNGRSLPWGGGLRGWEGERAWEPWEPCRWVVGWGSCQGGLGSRGAAQRQCRPHGGRHTPQKCLLVGTGQPRPSPSSSGLRAEITEPPWEG